MIGAIVVTLIVYAIVASYMGIVNRMLRADEYWSESNQVKLAMKTAPSLPSGLAVSPVHA